MKRQNNKLLVNKKNLGHTFNKICPQTMIKIAMHNACILAKPSAMKAGIILHTLHTGH